MALTYEASTENLFPLADAQIRPPEAQARRRQRLALLTGLIVLDALMLLATFQLVYFLRFQVFGFLFVPEGSVLDFYSSLAMLLIPAWLIVLASYRLYDLRLLHGGTAEYRRLASACTFAIIVLLGFSFFLDEKLIISRAWLLMIWVFSIIMLGLNRFAFRRVVYRLRKHGLALSRVLVVGANREAYEVGQHLSKGRNQPGIEVIGFVGDRRAKSRLTTPESEEQIKERRQSMAPGPAGRWLGLPGEVRRVVEQNQIDEVVIASTALDTQELFEVVRVLTTSKVEIRLSPSLYEILTTSQQVQEINGLPLVTVSKVRITGLNAMLKRTLDLFVSASVLLLLSPILLYVGWRVRRDSAGPAFYRRRVVGQGGKVFDAYKFRTMHADGEAILAAQPELLEELARTGKLKDDPRITAFGKFLRKTSLDELPQLLNVLRGQMSLVGPRMITYQEMTKFGRWQSNLMTVKPGLTGLWQISGRSNLSYEDRVRLDMHYIRNYSLWADLQILFQTVPVVLRGTGAY